MYTGIIDEILGVVLMKFAKKLIVASLVLGMSFSLFACGGQATNEEKQAENTPKLTIEDGKLTVAMECAYAPFNWTQTDDANGAVKVISDGSYANGYDVQMAKKVAEDLGLELAIQKIAWDGLIPAVSSSTVDLVMAGMSPTAERKQAVDFTEPYYESQLVMVIKKDSKFKDAKSIKDFKGAKLTAQLNTFHYKALEQVEGADKLPGMKDFGVMRLALRSGSIDGYVSENPEAVSASTAFDDITYIEFTPENGFQASSEDIAIAAAAKKGNDALVDKANAALAKVSTEDRNKLMDEMIKIQPVTQE